LCETGTAQCVKRHFQGERLCNKRGGRGGKLKKAEIEKGRKEEKKKYCAVFPGGERSDLKGRSIAVEKMIGRKID